jgi:peptidoglycan/LPS O-acetylase OafA/YrhL
MLYIIGIWHLSDYVNHIFTSPITNILTLCALSIFVYMSGFLLTSKYGSVNTIKDLNTFLIKRLFRIYPLYLSALVLFFLTGLITYMKAFLAAIFFMDVILNIPITTLWFISMIFVYYLLIPIISYHYSKKKSLLIVVLFIAFCAAIHIRFNRIDMSLISFFPSFILGFFSARHSVIIKLIKTKTFAVTSLLYIATTIYLSYTIESAWTKEVLRFIVAPLSISPLIVFSELLASKTDLGIIRKLSYASFCMYLYHRVVYCLILRIYHPETNILTILYLMCIGLPSIYFISKLVQSKFDCFLEWVFQSGPMRFYSSKRVS